MSSRAETEDHEADEPDVTERAICRYCEADYDVDESTWQQTRCPECGSWNDRPTE